MSEIRGTFGIPCQKKCGFISIKILKSFFYKYGNLCLYSYHPVLKFFIFYIYNVFLCSAYLRNLQFFVSGKFCFFLCGSKLLWNLAPNAEVCTFLMHAECGICDKTKHWQAKIFPFHWKYRGSCYLKRTTLSFLITVLIGAGQGGDVDGDCDGCVEKNQHVDSNTVL